MTQKIDGENHQIAHKGNIINCHGRPDCPLNAVPESQLQAEFAQRIGIWCRREAREFLELLMRDHGFTGKDLAIAWKTDSLAWNDDGPIIRTPLVEAVFGWSMFFAMTMYFIVFGVPLLFVRPVELNALAGFALSNLIFIGSAWVVGRTILRPRRIALQVKRLLANGDCQ
jgi:hypothetical protein